MGRSNRKSKAGKNNIHHQEYPVKVDISITPLSKSIKFYTESSSSLSPGFVLLDIERALDENQKWKITEIALVYSDEKEHDPQLTHTDLRQVLEHIEQAQVIVGHNIRGHDIPSLYTASKRKQPAELSAKICDTLELSSLFFVGQPQHKLNKFYRQELGLNNPIEDAWESYAIYKTIFDNRPELPLLVRYWAWQLLPPGYPRDLIYEAESLEKTEWDRLKYTKLNSVALENYLQGLSRHIKNLGAIVFLNWLYQLNESRVRRPVWLESEFPTFSAAENQAFSIPVDEENLLNELQYFFGYTKFREHQLEITQAILKGKTVPLGILPTGGGKSIIFQLPALIYSCYHRGLSIIISPLQALMTDQVQNLKQKLEEQKLPEYAERVEMLAGTQTLIEQRHVIDSLWHGEIDILYLSPERLRQPTIQRILKHRLPNIWILDEAHTLSQWGHDFRPDFLRIANGLNKFYHGSNKSASFGLLTATATIKVEQDIEQAVKQLGSLVNGSFQRLPIGEKSFQWREEITSHVEIIEKHESINEIPNSQRFKKTKEYLEKGKGLGVAIVYVPTRKMAEKYAHTLNNSNFIAKPFHAQIMDKQQVIADFKAGNLDVVVATNAFGMGIDRERIHTVIHVAPPATPEAYVQEIGRLARKEGEKGSAYLFWHPDDFNRIFEQEAQSQISFKALNDCWKIILSRLNEGKIDEEKIEKKNRERGEVWVSALDFATPLGQKNQDLLITQTRVAIYYLEKSELIKEQESCPCYLNICLKKELNQEEINKLHNKSKIIGQFLFEIGLRNPQTKSIPIDVRDISLSIGISPIEVIKSVRQFVKDGLADWEYKIAFKLNKGTRKKLDQLKLSTESFLNWLNTESPEFEVEGYIKIHLDALEQKLKQLKKAELIESLQFLKKLKLVNYKEKNREIIYLSLKREERLTQWLNIAYQELEDKWQEIDNVEKCLDELFKKKKWAIEDSQILDLAKLEKFCESKNHEINNIWEVLFLMQRLNLVVMGRGNFGIEMLYHLKSGENREKWSKGVYKPLAEHYEQRKRRIHAMRLLLEEGVQEKERIQILQHYFTQSLDEFDKLYFSEVENLEGESWNSPIAKKILENLNPIQKQIVTDDQSRALLILAGPGSGKTHTIVSRVGYLISAKSVPPEQILVLAYNRTAAAEVRKRLYQLLGQSGKRVHALTFHALATKLTGLKKSNYEKNDHGENFFDWLLVKLVDHIRENHPGYQYILIDEYQDINELQYNVITSLASFDNQDEEESQKSFLTVVGDDDQNLFQFRGADIKFIQRFCEDYKIADAARISLIQNYRSRPTIVEFANNFIEKTISPEKRLKGVQERIESVNNDQPGKILWGEYHHPYHAASWIADKIAEILTNPNLPKENIAVLAHQWKDLRFLQHVIKERWGDDQDIAYQFYTNKDDLRPINSCIGQAILQELMKQPDLRVDNPQAYLENLRKQLGYSDCDAAWPALLHALVGYSKITQEDIAYYLEEARPLRPGRVILSTFHSAKGSEFSHVFILENGYYNDNKPDSRSRELYVGFTRAKEELYILLSTNVQSICPDLIQVLTNLNSPCIQKVVVDEINLPASICYQWFLEPQDLFLSEKKIINNLGRKNIESYASKWGELYLFPSSDPGIICSKNGNYPVAVLSQQGKKELSKHLHNSLTVKSYTIFRVERDDDFYRKAYYQGQEDHHYIVLPYFNVEEFL